MLAVEFAIFELAYRAVDTLRLGPERALPDWSSDDDDVFDHFYFPCVPFYKFLLQGALYTEEKLKSKGLIFNLIY